MARSIGITPLTQKWKFRGAIAGARDSWCFVHRRIQRCFGRTIQFSGVTELGCRNGAVTWAECSGGGFRSRGGLGTSQSFGLRVCPLAESLARGRVEF